MHDPTDRNKYKRGKSNDLSWHCLYELKIVYDESASRYSYRETECKTSPDDENPYHKRKDNPNSKDKRSDKRDLCCRSGRRVHSPSQIRSSTLKQLKQMCTHKTTPMRGTTYRHKWTTSNDCDRCCLEIATFQCTSCIQIENNLAKTLKTIMRMGQDALIGLN